MSSTLVGRQSKAARDSASGSRATPPSAPARTPVGPRRSRAVRLIEKTLERGTFTPDGLAEHLVVLSSELARYRSGEALVPLPRQLLLALLVIDRIPELAREAYGLHAQARAEITLLARETECHVVAPPARFR